jgi:MFS family permease
MRAAVASVSAVIVTIFFIQLGNGLQTSLLSVRAGFEAFPAAVLGIIMASYYVGYSAAPLMSRTIIGRFGHVAVMGVGAFFAALAILLHPLLVSPIIWCVLRVISGFALSSLYVGAESWIHDRVGNAERGRVFSVYMVAQMVAMTGSQLLLSVGNPHHIGPFVLAGALILVGGLPVLIARHTAPDRAPPQPFGFIKLFQASPLGAIVTVLAGVTWSIVFTFGPAYAQRSGFDLTQTSIFMALAMLGGALIQFPVGWLSDAVGRRVTIALLSVGGLAAALFGLWADGQGDVIKYVASFLAGGLIFPMYVVSVAHTNDRIAPENRVAAAAGMVLLFGLGSIFGPLVAGGAVTGMGTGGYYTVLAATLAASLAVAAIAR